ncbi:hypothetical protein BKA69DRAFT_1172956 [Paraphysoderma sedebokerense]|nr:hypothetical protein BKA69DRAFT_1172956 [Paraphysoderma sedebokerense]
MEGSTPPDVPAYITTVVVWNAYIICSTILFCALQKKDFIRKRNVTACLFQVFFSLWCGNVWLARLNLWPSISNSVPWIVAAVSNYVSVINWYFSYFTRTVILLNDYYSAKIASMINKKSGVKSEEDVLKLLCLNKGEKFALRLQKKLVTIGQPSSSSHNRQETIALLTNKVGIVRGIGFYALLKWFLYSTIVELIIVLVVTGYTFGFSTKALAPNLATNGLEWIVKDSLYLKLEQTVALVFFYPFFVLYFLTYYVRAVANVFTFGHTMWFVILLTIAHTTTVTAPALYALLKRDTSDQKALLNSSLESFSRVLNDPFLFGELKQILVENFSIENALFMEEYGALVPSGLSKQTHTILDAEGTQLHIQSIIKNFIVSGAPNELNITSKTRRAIVAASQRGGQLSADILEPAKEEVVQMMYQNSYPRLLRRISIAKKNQEPV